MLDQGDWDGDRDRLSEQPAGEQWAPVAAERHTCTARHCPSYNGCSYYRSRARLAQSQGPIWRGWPWRACPNRPTGWP